jgi:hypothetical protein
MREVPLYLGFKGTCGCKLMSSKANYICKGVDLKGIC